MIKLQQGNSFVPTCLALDGGRLFYYYKYIGDVEETASFFNVHLLEDDPESEEVLDLLNKAIRLYELDRNHRKNEAKILKEKRKAKNE